MNNLLKFFDISSKFDYFCKFKKLSSYFYINQMTKDYSACSRWNINQHKYLKFLSSLYYTSKFQEIFKEVATIKIWVKYFYFLKLIQFCSLISIFKFFGEKNDVNYIYNWNKIIKYWNIKIQNLKLIFCTKFHMTNNSEILIIKRVAWKFLSYYLKLFMNIQKNSIWYLYFYK
jgi:hypothetical protein